MFNVIYENLCLRKDIKIYVGNELSNVKKCPTTIVSNNPCFKWILPDDLKGKQTRFCLQIKSVTPHILSSGKKDYAFYQSGDVESNQNTFEINFGTTGLLLQSWRGAIAIRLFISTRDKEEVYNAQTPYEYVSDDSYVPGIDWKDDKFDISDETRYFVFDDKSETFVNVNDIVCRWKNSYDLNNDKLVYYAQISKSPLFKREVNEFEIIDNQKTYSKLNTILDNDTSYFFRVRAFDGLDYSDWSATHGLQLTSNEKPVVEILSLENLGYGDIKINFRVYDTKQNKITLRLLYSGGSVTSGKAVPTLLEPLHFFIITEENKGYGSLIWKSLYNETKNADNFFLYMLANDGFDDSEEFIYGAFSIHNKELFHYKTGGGSYFLTFDVNGKIDLIEKPDLISYSYSVPAIGRNGIIKNYKYLGYDNSSVPFENITVYGMLFAENPNTFCVYTPATVYRTIYHHGKYMLYDYDIPSRNSEEKSSTTANEDISLNDNNNEDEDKGKLENDPYVIAPVYNPTLNVDKKGVNKSVVYSTTKKLEDEEGNPLSLPNGEWYSETEEENGVINYIQIWGNEFNGKNCFEKFVFEDGESAPQYTLNPYDLDANGYPKPVSYSTFENIGKDTVIYIKKYRIENGFEGEPKNFTVKKVENKFEREYFGVRGTPPQIVYEKGIPYWSYNGELINKYDPEKMSEEDLKELPEDFPEDAIYLPQSFWKKKIKYQHIAVPYYVPSTEAIYRPGDHRIGVVGKGEPIIVEAHNKTVKIIETKNTQSVPTMGKTAAPLRENLYVGYSIAKSNGMYLSQDGNLYIKSDGGINNFIYKNDTIEEFLKRNPDALIEFKKDTVVIYINTNFEKLKDAMIDRNAHNQNILPYYAYLYKSEDETVSEIRYFIVGNSKEFELDGIIDKNAKKYVEINIAERLYYSFVNDTPFLIPQDYGFSVFGSNMKEQRYLPDKRDKGKDYEKFDFLDYVCNGKFLEGETMYYAGVNGWVDNEVVDDYNRAIKFVCNIKLAEKLQELKIIYLQYYWDSYNQIHWTGNLGVETYIRIEYTKVENGKEVGWSDLKFENSIYNEQWDTWLIKPQTYASLIDNFNYKQFDDECQYRMRISGFDLSGVVPNVIGPVIATPDFYIDDDAINPFVIEEMKFDPWKKQLEIRFRVDDLQGDLYDITSMKFTTDEKTWGEINLGDVIGDINNLNSNTLKNRETNQIITHTIYWSVSGYVSKSSSVRIQIYGTLSKYNVDFDYPFFSWVCWDNQRIKLAEDEENRILGQWVRYEKVTDKNGNSTWKELNTPVRQSNGELENTVNSINAIQLRYENSDKSLSYDEWLQSTYDGGITLASRIRTLESNQKDLQKRLDNAKRLRFAGECFTRKELIKQGFYCNGFVDNDPKKPVFEYKVLNLPSSGHASTIDWGSEEEKTSLLNGDFSELTEVVANIESLKDAGFKVVLPLPVGVTIDDKTTPALVEVYKNNSKNYLHINNSNKIHEEQEGECLSAEINVLTEKIYSEIDSKINVISKKKTSFYLELDDTYALGKYELFFDVYTGNKDISNNIIIKLERYGSDGLIKENEIANLNVINSNSVKQTFYYNEENESIIDRLEYTRLVFICTGDIYITGIGIGISEIIKEDEESDDYSVSNIIVKGKIGERQTSKKSYPVVGKMLSDDEMSDEEKYTVYYRFQLDFQKDFYSQRFGNPLRDIIFTNVVSTGELSDNEEEKARIRGGNVRGGVFLINKDVTNHTNNEVTTAVDEIIKESESLETETMITGTGEVTKITFDPNNDRRKYGNLTISKSDLPGEWKKHYINESFPDVKDETKFTSGFFNGNYHWRIAPYNVVECDYEEVSHSIIQSINKATNAVSVELKAYSNETIEELKFNGNFWYCKEFLESPYWEFDWIEEKNKELYKDNLEQLEYNRGVVTFPTDAPRNENGGIIMGENSISHIPSSIDRSKPFVIKDNDEFNYYMFYSKTSLLNQNVIIQSTGKKWDTFGELSQIYPQYVLDTYKDYVSIFSPCALFVSLNKKQDDEIILPETFECLEAQITVTNNNNSTLDAEVFVTNKNIESNDELPCFIYVKPKQTLQKVLYVWATAQTKNNSLITLLFISDVGKVDFENPVECSGLDGLYHPCVIQTEEKMYMIGCKNYLNKSCLFLYSSKNGIDWKEENNGNPVLNSSNNISSPCISVEQNGYKVYLTEWVNGKSQITSYETIDLINFNSRRVELNNSFNVYTENNTITYNNPKNACIIDDVYLGNKVKRMYYNVDVNFNGKTESIIKTMFLENGKWKKGTKGTWGDTELHSTIFGKNNIIGLNIDDAINVNGVRLEIDLSDAYRKMPKECILQSDWINKDNYSDFDAEISPSREFIYNSILKDKKYTGE